MRYRCRPLTQCDPERREDQARGLELPKAAVMVIAMLHPDRRPRRILIQRQRAGARELQAGDERAGYRHATAQRATGLYATDRREEGRQRTAVRQHSEQLAHTSDRVAALPKRWRPGAT